MTTLDNRPIGVRTPEDGPIHEALRTATGGPPPLPCALTTGKHRRPETDDTADLFMTHQLDELLSRPYLTLSGDLDVADVEQGLTRSGDLEPAYVEPAYVEPAYVGPDLMYALAATELDDDYDGNRVYLCTFDVFA